MFPNSSGLGGKLSRFCRILGAIQPPARIEPRQASGFERLSLCGRGELHECGPSPMLVIANLTRGHASSIGHWRAGHWRALRREPRSYGLGTTSTAVPTGYVRAGYPQGASRQHGARLRPGRYGRQRGLGSTCCDFSISKTGSSCGSKTPGCAAGHCCLSVRISCASTSRLIALQHPREAWYIL